MNFIDVLWSKLAFRGKGFGVQAIFYAYFEGRSGEIIVETGSLEESNVGFEFGSRGMPGFGVDADRANATFTDMETGELLNFGSMYLTADGVDPYAGKATGWYGQTRKARENAALKPNHKYRLAWNVTDEGHSSWVPKVKVIYKGIDCSSTTVIADTVEAGDIKSIVLDGVPGIWYAEDPEVE